MVASVNFSRVVQTSIGACWIDAIAGVTAGDATTAAAVLTVGVAGSPGVAGADLVSKESKNDMLMKMCQMK